MLIRYLLSIVFAPPLTYLHRLTTLCLLARYLRFSGCSTQTPKLQPNIGILLSIMNSSISGICTAHTWRFCPQFYTIVLPQHLDINLGLINWGLMLWRVKYLIYTLRIYVFHNPLISLKQFNLKCMTENLNLSSFHKFSICRNKSTTMQDENSAANRVTTLY